MQWNGLSSKSVIRVGDRLTIAGKRTTVAGNNEDSESKADTAPPASVTHKVAKGETPGEIASRYGVKTRDLLSWNKLTAKSIIRVGQELTVHHPAKGAGQRDRGNDVTVAQASSSGPVVHKVTAGQNPTTIAKHYGVSVNDLFKWNNWNTKHVLHIGDEVAIYRD